MKYQVAVAGHEFEVVYNGAELVVDGDLVETESLENTGANRVFLIGGRMVSLSFEKLDDRWLVRRSGDAVEVSVETERDRLLKRYGAAGGSGASNGKVKAPMPGLVLRLLVAEGDRVEKGQGLLVLEAMKMENEIKSPVAGVVGPLRVELGVAVEKGKPLLEVFPEG